MYGLNAVAIVFFVCINILAYRLCKCSENTHRKITFLLCVLLLSVNLFRYCIIYPMFEKVVMIPVEFSTFSYFAVPSILLISKKKLHSWAA